MLGWFRSKPECPVDAATREWIDERWDWLEGQFGPERLHATAVVLPRPEFFPDAYHGAEGDVRRMLDRVCAYMAIDPAAVELSLYEDRNPVYEGEWRRGTAGLYHPEAGKFRVRVEVANLDDPLGMTVMSVLGRPAQTPPNRSRAELAGSPVRNKLTVGKEVIRPDRERAGGLSRLPRRPHRTPP